MQLSYTIREDDYLMYNLYNAKTNNTYKNYVVRDLTTWVGLALILLAFFMMMGNLTTVFITLTLSTIILVWRFFRLKDYFAKQYKEQLKHVGVESAINYLFLEQDFIRIETADYELKLRCNSINKIGEMKQLFFIQTSLMAIIIPTAIEAYQPLKEYLKKISKEQDLQFVEDLGYKW